MHDPSLPKHLRYQKTPRPIAAMEINYVDGTTTGAHSHPRAQLLYAIEGVMVVRSSAGYWVVPPNRAVWLTAHVVHEVRMCGDVKVRTVYVDPDASDQLPAACCVIGVSALLRELIVAAVDVPLDYVSGSRDERVMQLILDELSQLEVLPLHLPMPTDTRVHKVCVALNASLDDPATIEQWGERVGVTGKTLQRLFLKETGLSFGQWRQHARLLLALERLASGARIIDVALESGYASQSAFTVMFRKHFGIPPSVFYRQSE